MVNLKQHTRVLVSKPNRRKFDILDKLEGNNNNMQLWIEKLKKKYWQFKTSLLNTDKGQSS